MAILEQSPLYREMVKRSEQRGIAIGEQRGKREGITIGEQRTTERVATNMLRMGMAIEQVSEVTGLSVEQVARLHSESSASE